MKLAILKRDGKTALAAIYGDRYVELPAALAALSEEPVGELREFIRRWDGRIPELNEKIRGLSELMQPLGGCEYLPPVPASPRLITARGNSTIFTRVIKAKLPKQPTLEMRYAFNMAGHDSVFTFPEDMPNNGWNMELVAVIGKEASGVKREDAYSHVFGYTLMLDHGGRRENYPFANQWATPDAEKTMMDWFYEGNFNNNASVPLPVGPVIVTRDEIPDPHDLMFEERESGRLIVRAHSSSVLFDIPEIVAYISAFSTFEPGDMLSTASIGYDGYGAWPDRMPEGAYYEATMEGIGTLRLNVVDKRRLS